MHACISQAVVSNPLGQGLDQVDVAAGNARALYPATIAVLQQLGLLPAVENTPLASWLRPRLRNYAGLQVGEIRPTVTLLKA